MALCAPISVNAGRAANRNNRRRLPKAGSAAARFFPGSDDDFGGWHGYACSKLANLLFTAELTRRLRSQGVTGVTALACHPGTTTSRLVVTALETSSWYYNALWSIGRFFPLYQTAAMGALPTLYAATAPHVRGGDYYGPGGFQAMWGYPALEQPSQASTSEADACRLWEASERLTGVSFPIHK